MTKKLPNAAGDRGEIQDALGAISWDKRMADARARRAKVLASRAPSQPVANERRTPSAVAASPAPGDPGLTDTPPDWMTDGVETEAPVVPDTDAVAPMAAARVEEEDPFAAPRRARRVAIIGSVAGAFAFGIVAGLGALTITRLQETDQLLAVAPTPQTSIATPSTISAPEVGLTTAPVAAAQDSAPTLGAPASPAPTADVETASLGDIAAAALPPAERTAVAVAPETGDETVPALTAALAASIPQLAPSSRDGVPAIVLASRAIPLDALLPPTLTPPAIDASLPGAVFTDPPVSQPWEPRGLAMALERDFRIVLTAAGSMSGSRFDDYVAAAEATGLPLATTQRVGYTITRDQVRFFHDEDIAAAGTLADAVDAELRDFTAFSPKPPVGSIEIYLSDSADAPPVVDSETAEIERLRDRLVNSLQRGDHL
ncbi:MAG: hypothetical protein AAFY77_04740 [Pseudomonadota bacterium]